MPWPNHLSLNLQTTEPRPLAEVLDACKAAGVTHVGLFRVPHVEPYGFPRALEMVRNSGLSVSVYAAVGSWRFGRNAAASPQDALKHNIEMIDEAAQLGAPVLSILTGAPDKDIATARQRIIEALSDMAPHAAERGVQIAIEPIHPIYGRRAFYTLGQALDVCDEVGHPNVGVVADIFHQWWELDLLQQLRRGISSNRIFLVQVSDWSQELTRSKPFSRAVMGEGDADFDLFAEGLKGYQGFFDIEVLTNDEMATLSLPALIERLATAHEKTLGMVNP